MKRLLSLLFGIAIMLSCATIGYSETGIDKKDIQVVFQKGIVDHQDIAVQKVEAVKFQVPVEGTPILDIEVSTFSVTIFVKEVTPQNVIREQESHIRPPPGGPI